MNPTYSMRSSLKMLHRNECITCTMKELAECDMLSKKVRAAAVTALYFKVCSAGLIVATADL